MEQWPEHLEKFEASIKTFSESYKEAISAAQSADFEKAKSGFEKSLQTLETELPELLEMRGHVLIDLYHTLVTLESPEADKILENSGKLDFSPAIRAYFDAFVEVLLFRKAFEQRGESYEQSAPHLEKAKALAELLHDEKAKNRVMASVVNNEIFALSQEAPVEINLLEEKLLAALPYIQAVSSYDPLNAITWYSNAGETYRRSDPDRRFSKTIRDYYTRGLAVTATHYRNHFGYIRALLELKTNIGDFEAGEGNYAEAKTALLDSLENARFIEDTYMEVAILAYLAKANAGLGDCTEAKKNLEDSEKLLKEHFADDEQLLSEVERMRKFVDASCNGKLS